MYIPPEGLAEALRRRPHIEHPALPGRRNHLRAGVVVPLVWRADGLDALVTLRPAAMRRHAGEISFPGGRREPEDVDLEATARRETAEEIGLERLNVLGRLASMPLYTSEFRLEPFVAQVDPGEPIRPDPHEVESVLTIDLAQVLRSGQVEAIDGVHDGAPFRMPIFRPGDHVMFGATALTLWELVGVLAQVAGVPVPELVPGDLSFEGVLTHGAGAARMARQAR